MCMLTYLRMDIFDADVHVCNITLVLDFFSFFFVLFVFLFLFLLLSAPSKLSMYIVSWLILQAGEHDQSNDQTSPSR